MGRNTPITVNNELRDRIAVRAYELYQDRGGQNGSDVDDWLQAEREILAGVEQQTKFPEGKGPSSTRSEAVLPSTRKARNAANITG